MDIIDRKSIFTYKVWRSLLSDELNSEIDMNPVNSLIITYDLTFKSFINNLFNWKHTVQGQDFWQEIYDTNDVSQYLKQADLTGFTIEKVDEKKLIRSYY